MGQITLWSLLVYLAFRLGDMAIRPPVERSPPWPSWSAPIRADSFTAQETLVQDDNQTDPLPLIVIA
jgi:hypothetical protein